MTRYDYTDHLSQHLLREQSSELNSTLYYATTGHCLTLLQVSTCLDATHDTPTLLASATS